MRRKGDLRDFEHGLVVGLGWVDQKMLNADLLKMDRKKKKSDSSLGAIDQRTVKQTASVWPL